MALSVPSFKPILSQWYGHMKSTIGSREQGSKYGQGGSNRKSSVPELWGPLCANAKLKTSVQSGGPSGVSRDSSEGSLLGSNEHIHVTTDLDLRSIPLAKMNSRV
jgi:hypothetical protein